MKIDFTYLLNFYTLFRYGKVLECKISKTKIDMRGRSQIIFETLGATIRLNKHCTKNQVCH